MAQYKAIFTEDTLTSLFPTTRADEFFEALFGDAEEGSYDIALHYVEGSGKMVNFELQLKERPGKCLACNLTYGLPQVFSRHPIINLQGLADAVADAAGGSNATWKVGATREVTNKLHVIPLGIQLG